MYTREIQPPRFSPVEDGIPIQGTWTRAFEEVNLLDIRKPYRLPLPGWIRDNRVKEWESFFIQDDRFLLFAMLSNFKFYRTAMVFMYDRENKELLKYRKVIPGSGWKLPRGLNNASVDSRSWGFFFRIHSWLDAGTIRLDLDIEATRKRPSFTAHAAFIMEPATEPAVPVSIWPEPAKALPEDGKITPMAVSLLFSDRRSMYAYKVMAPVRGDMVFGGRHISLDPATTSGFFGDFKGYFPYGTDNYWCTAAGFDSSGRRFGFSIGENQVREPFKNNENAFWLDGRLTPLPPVKITRPGGIESEWVIQDMEGMVDLVFTPKKQLHYGLNLILARTECDSPVGYYNGVLVNADGEEIPVKNLWGIGQKLYLRV
jgi:hypothetical protein